LEKTSENNIIIISSKHTLSYKDFKKSVLEYKSNLHHRIESDILRDKYHIKIPTYHGCKYDGPCLRRYVKHCAEVAYDIYQYILKLKNRCNEEVARISGLSKTTILILDELFMILRQMPPTPRIIKIEFK